MKPLSFVALFLSAVTSAPMAQQPPTVRVLASNGVKAVMESVEPDAERAIGQRLEFEFSTAASLKAKIEAGGAFDVAILTPAIIDDLVAQAKIAAASRRNVARGGVGIGVREGSPVPAIGTVDELKSVLLDAESVAFTADGQSRITIDRVFEELGIVEAMRAKTLLKGPGEAPEAVAAGEAELVLTLVSEILPVAGLGFVGPLPAAVQGYVAFTAGRSAAAANAAGADALLAYLGSPALAAAFEAYGMEPYIADPIPEPIANRGLAVEIREVARLPDSRGAHPATEDTAPHAWARVSLVRDLPDGRRFANDSRGMLYLLDRDNRPSLYANVATAFPHGFYQSLQSGFIGFEFHPEFARNGLFYTVHGEKPNNPATPHFIPPRFTRADVTYHSVVTEWRANDPAARVFEGTHRELLRVGHVVEFFRHPLGHVEFNPTSAPGDADYGLLYVGGGDLGFSNGGGAHASDPTQLQRLDTVLGTILRIDPRSPSASGGAKGVGDYTIPPINRFAADGDPETLGEIFAYGFRNAHRLSWDLTDGTLYAADIGMSHIEEINIVREGENYGWMQREGVFDNGVVRGGVLDEVFALSADVLDGRTKDGFTYPVLMYDHDEGEAITAGFVYHGRIPALRGKFVFGDIPRGRLFAADVAAMQAADDGIPLTVAPVEEIQLYVRDASGKRRDVTLRELAEEALGMPIPRVDLQVSRSGDGELFVTSRQDGVIRILVAD